jgi:hypothetical protein
MRILISFLLVLGSITLSRAQLWSEDFSGEANNAISGTATGGTWTSITPSGGVSSFSRQNILGAGLFRANNTGTEGVWETNIIDISGTGAATISITLTTALTNATDYMRAYYVLDGGTEIMFAELLGQFVSLSTTGSAIVAGNSLKVVVRSMENT